MLYTNPLDPNNPPQVAQGLANPPAPMPAPQPMQMPQAQPQAPAAQPFSMPFSSMFDPVQPNSALNQPQVQDQLTNSLMNLTASAVNGANSQQSREFAATKIFGGAAAALGGLMGGGYAQGGLHALNLVNQQVEDAKSERRQQQQQALTGVQTLGNILRNTSRDSQKSLADAVKAELKGQEIDIKKQRAGTYAEAVAGKIAAGGTHNDILKAHYKALEDAKIDANDVQWAKLDQMATLAEEKNKLQKELDEAKTNRSKYSADKSYDAKIKSLNERTRELNSAHRFLAQQFDINKTAQIARKDAQGNPVYGQLELPALSSQIQDLEPLEEAASTVPPQVAAPAATTPTAGGASKASTPGQQKALNLMQQYTQMLKSGSMPPEVYMQKLQSFQTHFPMLKDSLNGQ